MKIRIDRARLSNVYVHTAGKPFDADGKEKFACHGILDPNVPADAAEIKKVREAIVATAKQTWGEKYEAKLKAISAAGRVWCLRDGDAKENSPAYAGKLFVAAKSEQRPLVIGGGADGMAPLVAADGKPYPGCYGALMIEIKASDLPQPQVYARLLGVQFREDGERLAGGAIAAADDFASLPAGDKAAVEQSKGGASALF